MKTKNLLFMIGLISLFGVIEGNAQATHNTIIGPNNNTNATSNVAIGDDPNQFTNAAANWNTFVGALAGNINTSGEQNTFIGYVSGNGNTTGSGNTALGVGSFQTSIGNANIGIGQNGSTHVTGSNNIYLGNGTGNFVTGDGNNFLGGSIHLNSAPGTLNNTVILGDGVGNQRMYIDNIGRVGFGLGNFTVPGNRLEINSIWNTAGLAPGTAGLRFRGFTNSNFNTLTAAATPKVLSINGDGDVILVDDAVGSGGSSNDDWDLLGNSGTNPALNFLGTTDNNDLIFRRNNIKSGLLGSTNTAFGVDALAATNNGNSNTAVGVSALRINASASSNTAFGVNSLSSLTSGLGNNTAIGFGSLADSVTGNFNVALGYNSGLHNKGNSNTIIGADALGQGNTDWNVAIGRGAGAGVTGGFRSIFIGNNAGPGSGSINNRLYINSAIGFTTTPLIYGEFDNQNLTFNVAASAGGRVKIDRGTAYPNSSGLNFACLNSSSPAPANTTNGKFLTVSTVGDVVLETLPNGGANCNIYTCDDKLTGNRTVDMDNNSMIFDTQQEGRIYIGDTNLTNPFVVAVGNNFPPVSIPDSNYRLLVEGGILTEKVKIALRHSGTDWADYVFANDYKLMPLKEVESFVKENKHLPGISSANDLVKEGLDVADMQSKQMGKIEELTLYLIEQSKQIEELKAQVKALLEKK